MTLTHPVTASMRDERDVEHPTVEVPALDTHVVEDGDALPAEHIREEFTSCFCQDGRHRPEDRDDLARHQRTYPPVGAHRLKAYIYAVIVEEKTA